MPLGVEQVHAPFVQGKREPLADFGFGHAQAFAHCNEGALGAAFEVEQGVLAQWLDQPYRQGSVGLAAGIDLDMLGTDPKGSLAGAGRFQALWKRNVEQRRAEACNTVVAHDFAGDREFIEGEPKKSATK